ncbi:hypothetical protein N8T08_009230 [Aspergillus melleus]|uniref:Uncharacterized protein n=1 Tax=Aspergillus melleus TaxID=138277 RepID=A0ACC3AUB6_9EURO|nr:hypothetical protein N8T08_009230 [Aspergillus melleus]
MVPADDEIVTTAPEDETAETAHVDDPDIEEYPQPEYCPYEGRPVTVLIGPSKKCYTIPRPLVDKFPYLRTRLQTGPQSGYHYYGMQEENIFATITLSDVDEDIGHTLMHFLYTGNFQTVKISSGYDQPKRTREYTRCVLAYRAAVTYRLDALEDLAKQYMETFDSNLIIFEIISLARENFAIITKDGWYSDYLTARILAAFDADDRIFQQEEFFEGFGNSSEFDKFLAKTIVLAYSQKLSVLQCELPPIHTSAAESMPGNGVENNIVCNEPKTAEKLDDGNCDSKITMVTHEHVDYCENQTALGIKKITSN